MIEKRQCQVCKDLLQFYFESAWRLESLGEALKSARVEQERNLFILLLIQGKQEYRSAWQALRSHLTSHRIRITDL